MSETPPLDPIRERVKLHRGNYPALAEKAGISLSWLGKYANGKLECDKISTARALVAAMNEMDAERLDFSKAQGAPRAAA